jgi:hypothetical protein
MNAALNYTSRLIGLESVAWRTFLVQGLLSMADSIAVHAARDKATEIQSYKNDKKEL